MASKSEVTETNPAVEPKSASTGPGFFSLLIMMLLTVLLTVGGVAGALIYLTKSGRLASVAASAGTGAASSEPAILSTHVVVLEPLLVNLVDVDGHCYLRAGVTLRVQDTAKEIKAAKSESEAKDTKGASEVSAPLRDTVLDVLGRQRSTELLLTDGKDKLKAVLKKALLDRNPEIKVTEIYFTEFLVQR